MVIKQNLNEAWTAFIQDGNDHSFYEIYTHYYHYLHFIGLKKNFKGDKVKAAISDVFFYLWEQREKIGHINHYHNYIITSFLRTLYKQDKFSSHESLDLEDLPAFGLSPSVEELHIDQENKANISNLLKKYIGALAPKQREMIYQKFYLGMSYQEIATGNGVSIHTVYNTVYKAVEKLKAQIGKEELLLLSIGISLCLLWFYFMI